VILKKAFEAKNRLARIPNLGGACGIELSQSGAAAHSGWVINQVCNDGVSSPVIWSFLDVRRPKSAPKETFGLASKAFQYHSIKRLLISLSPKSYAPQGWPALFAGWLEAQGPFRHLNENRRHFFFFLRMDSERRAFSNRDWRPVAANVSSI